MTVTGRDFLMRHIALLPPEDCAALMGVMAGKPVTFEAKEAARKLVARNILPATGLLDEEV
jgi:hypothetical protein